MTMGLQYNTGMNQSDYAGYQRAWLRKEAHRLQPVVHVGTGGVSDAVEQAIGQALDSHELIKVKFQSLKDERRDACAHIAESCRAVLVGVIGNVGIFFRPAEDPDKRRYRVPVRGGGQGEGRS